MMELNLLKTYCKCGCKEEITQTHKYYVKEYLPGHNWRNKKRGPQSEEHTNKMRLQKLGKPNPGAAKWARELGHLNKGRVHTEQSKLNMSIGSIGKGLGRIFSQETIEKIVAKNRGKKRSEETRKNISNACKGRIITQETIEKIVAKNRGRHCSDKSRKQMSLSAIERNKNPEYIEKLKNAQQEGYKNGTRKATYQKAYFSEYLNHSVRSSWEELYGYYLKINNVIYEYEKGFKVVFPDGSKHHYFPDFVENKSKVIHEVKGFFKNENSLIKLQAFKEQYPEYTLKLIGYPENLKKKAQINIHCDEILDIRKVNILEVL